jgi:hypothetical protein
MRVNSTTVLQSYLVRYASTKSKNHRKLSRFELVLWLSVLLILSSFSRGYAQEVSAWGDGDATWSSSTLNDARSDYFQGEVVPFGFKTLALTNGNSYTFTIVYDYYNNSGNKNAGGYAYITSYNISRTPPPLTGGSAPAIDNTFSGTGNVGAFYTQDADVTDASAPTGTDTKTVTVTFTYTGSTGGTAYIYWGMYLSKTGTVTDLGTAPTNGAGHWPGGSMSLVVSGTDTGGGNVGNNPGSGGVVDGVISGMKYSDLDKSGGKNGSEPGLSGWTIYIDNDSTGTLTAGDISTTTDVDGNYAFHDLLPRTYHYYVREVNQPNWTQTQPGSGASYQYAVDITAAIPVQANKLFGNFTCATPQPTITADGATTFCDGGSVLLTSSSATGNQWYKDGTILTGETNQTYTATSTGSYAVTVTLLDCPSTSDATAVTVDSPPTTATVGSTQNICGSLVSAGLGGNAPSVGTGTWTKKSGPGTVTFATDANTANATATVSAYGSYVFTWSIANGTCSASTADVTVNYAANVVCAGYNGAYFANTGSVNAGGSATVNLVYNISEYSSANCHNISGLTANSFTVTPNPSNAATIDYSKASYVGGVYTVPATITIPNNQYSITVEFTLGFTTSAYVFSNTCLDVPLVTVSSNSNDFVTGGGFVIPQGSYSKKPNSNADGLKNNFGFNVKWNKSMTNLQGNFNTIIRRSESDGIHRYQVKSANPGTLVVTKLTTNGYTNSYRADITYTNANIQDLTLGVATGEGPGVVYLTVIDNGEPGSNGSTTDQVLMTVKDKYNTLWYTSSQAANTNVGNLTLSSSIPLLSRGNIQVHTSAGGKAGAITTRDLQTLPTALTQTFDVTATPNPSFSYFNLHIAGGNLGGLVNVKVTDVLGRVVESRQSLAPGQTLRIGSEYKPGVYIVQVMQGDTVKQLKLVKQ